MADPFLNLDQVYDFWREYSEKQQSNAMQIVAHMDSIEQDWALDGDETVEEKLNELVAAISNNNAVQDLAKQAIVDILAQFFDSAPYLHQSFFL